MREEVRAESLVGALRERFDATSKIGVPAHLTVLAPFMDPNNITATVLEKAQRALERTIAFSSTLRSVGRFPATAYLVPDHRDVRAVAAKAILRAVWDAGYDRRVVDAHLSTFRDGCSDDVWQDSYPRGPRVADIRLAWPR